MKKQLLTIAGALSLSIIVATSSVAQSSQDSIPPAPYGMSNMNVYAVFVSSAKTKDLENALRYGRWLINYHTDTLEGVKQYDGPRTYDRMIDVYKGLAKKTNDPTIKSAYLDTAATIFDKAFKVFDKDFDRFQWHINRGLFYQTNASYVDNAYGEAYGSYMKAFEMDAERLTKLGKGYYFRITLSNLVNQGNKQKALEMVEKARPHASPEILDFIDKQLDSLFDDPAERIGFLEGKLKENPKDEEIMAELLELYEEMEMYKKGSEMAKRLYDAKPSYENTMRLAHAASAQAQYEQAIKYFGEALKKSETKEQKKKIYIELADAHLNLENLEQARKYARDASAIDSQWGEPYMKIAAIYAQLVSNCSADQMTREDKAVYWLVVDYLKKAKSVDSKMTNRANSRIRAYEASFPTSEEKFFNNWEDGQEIKIDGSLNSCYSWVNETTTIR